MQQNIFYVTDEAWERKLFLFFPYQQINLEPITY